MTQALVECVMIARVGSGQSQSGSSKQPVTSRPMSRGLGQTCHPLPAFRQPVNFRPPASLTVRQPPFCSCGIAPTAARFVLILAIRLPSTHRQLLHFMLHHARFKLTKSFCPEQA
ncbi:unnamed protein product [Protopolystoma xenopodis]|uniref:Uncharacterized protein n=1 Tax=Protopolystoma xenopodis TaxID=117903 RepID=A0A3S5CPS1_9PLAT|nr:unnamed protein product [Protopolystoma xenopodis]